MNAAWKKRWDYFKEKSIDTPCQRAAAAKHGEAAHNFDAMKNTYESSWYETIS